MEIDDLMQEAFLVLHDTAAGYDPDENVPFANYYAMRLQWGWARCIEDSGATIRLPSWMAGKVKRYRRAVTEYRAQYGVEPQEADLSRVLGVRVQELRTIRETARNTRLRSLNERIEAADGSGTELSDTIPDGRDEYAEVLEDVQHEQLAAVLWPIVDSLEGRQADVIRKRYRHGKTMKQCGSDVGISLEAVRLIEQKALRTLRSPANRRKLEPFAGDLYSRGIAGVGVSKFRQTNTSATERAALWFLERQEWEPERRCMNEDERMQTIKNKLLAGLAAKYGRLRD